MRWFVSRERPLLDEVAWIHASGAEVVNLEELAGRDGKRRKRAARLREILGANALARAAFEALSKIGYTKALFAGADEEEVAFLRSVGVEETDGIPWDALRQSEPGTTFQVRCMGDVHRLVLDGNRLCAADHQPDEITMLRLLGEYGPCVRAHGSLAAIAPIRRDEALGGLWDWLRDAGETLAGCKTGLDRRNGAWELTVGPITTRRRLGEEAPRFVLARVRTSTPPPWMTRALGAIDRRLVPWSPVAGLAAALIVEEETGAATDMAEAARLSVQGG